MPAHPLDMANRNALFERLRDCRAAQIVRRDIADAAEFGVSFDQIPDVPSGQRLVLAEKRLGWCGLKQIGIIGVRADAFSFVAVELG